MNRRTELGEAAYAGAQARGARVVLADDHELVRAGIEALLLEIEGIDVVASVSDGAELLEAVDRLMPDLVITDVIMPTMDGLEAIERIHTRHPGMLLLVLSMDSSGKAARQALDHGACGYIIKSAGRMELEVALRTVLAGNCYLSPLVTRALLDAQREPETPLTRRQVQILAMIAAGKSAKQIGFELQLSSKTVDVHRARIMERLGLRDVASLTRYAIKQGLVS